MKAQVLLCNQTLRSVTARTENDLSVVFQVLDGADLRPGDTLDIALPDVLALGVVRRGDTGELLSVRIRRDDVHDLRLVGGGHGVPSNVSDERMSAP